MTGVRLLAAAAALALAAFLPGAHVTAPAAFACSCLGPQPLAAYAREAHNAIFTGTAGQLDPRGVPVIVEHWFAGPGAAPQVWIAGDFGNGASCGVGRPPGPGSRWLWVAWRAEPGADLTITICQPTAALDTPEGQALLAEAVGTFGGGAAVPGPTAASDGDPVPDPAALAGAGVVLAAGVLVLATALLLARSRARRDP